MGFFSDLLRAKPAFTAQDHTVLKMLPAFKADYSDLSIHHEQQRLAGTNEKYVPAYVSEYMPPEKLRALEPLLDRWANKWGIALSVDRHRGVISTDKTSFKVLNELVLKAANTPGVSRD